MEDLCSYQNHIIAVGDITDRQGHSYVVAWDGTQPVNLIDVVSGAPHAAITYNGDLFLGGQFHTFDSFSYGLAWWDGSSYHLFGDGLINEAWGVATSLEAFCEYQGSLVAAGRFAAIGPDTAASIASFDGATWHPLGAGLGSTSPGAGDIFVKALAVFNNELYAGGSFDLAGGAVIPHIARWDGVAWQPVGDGLNGVVEAMAVYSGRLIVGGDFAMAGSTTVSNIAAWDGSTWAPLATGLDSTVLELVVYGRELVAGGTFQSAGPTAATYIARWDGIAWSPLGTGITAMEWDSLNEHVKALLVHDSTLYVGGYFVRAGSKVCESFAAWRPDFDGDAVIDPFDNCAGLPNPDQADTDNDGVGNACDLGCCNGIAGNVNNDSGDAVNVADLTYLVNYLFKGGPLPPCAEEGNVNGASPINVTDLTYLVNFLFKGGLAPVSCP